jgi:hypothetical protein
LDARFDCAFDQRASAREIDVDRHFSVEIARRIVGKTGEVDDRVDGSGRLGGIAPAKAPTPPDVRFSASGG